MAKRIRKASGIPRPAVTTGPIDVQKTRIARQALSSVGMSRSRQAGMMIDTLPSNNSTFWGSQRSLPAYQTSYVTGTNWGSGSTRDVPPYFVMMNEQNGGVLYWPVTLRERYEWFRYFARCFYVRTYDVNVLMKDGTNKKIQDVQVGDEIITGLGTIKKVKNKFERRAIENKSVTLKAWCLQNAVQSTHHHPYYILRNEVVEKENGGKCEFIPFKPEWVHAEDIRVGDYVLQAPYKPTEISDITTDQAKLLGYYAAEGSIVWGTRCRGTLEGTGWWTDRTKVRVPVGVCFTINVKEQDTLGKNILDCVKKVFGVDGRYVHDRKGSIEIIANGRDIGDYCLYHVGEYSDKKKLSVELINSMYESRKQFLLSYTEGDGHQYDERTSNNGKILISTASADLAQQVQLIAISVGIMCRIAKYKRSECDTGFKSDTDSWHITIPHYSADELCGDSCRWDEKGGATTRRGSLFVDGYVAYKVKEITYSQEDDIVYNLEIDAEGDEKSFIANGMVTHNTDAFCGRALELLSDLPLSKIALNMPRMEGKEELRKEIHDFYEGMCDNLGVFKLLQNILWEFNIIGNVHLYHEWNEKTKSWERVVMLPPEEVSIFYYPFGDNAARVEYRPEKLLALIKDATEGDIGTEIHKQIMKHIPQEIIDMVKQEGCIIMDTDPMSGSFVHHIARRKPMYQDLGASVLERVLIPLLIREHYKYTQLSISTRNMTPKNKISAPGLNEGELENLRVQVDLSYMDPEFSIVTNYDWQWEQLGADIRLLNLSSEYEAIENQIFAGLGVTRELLTGEGSYTGTKITVEILNTMFMLSREILQNYVEKQLFRPVAEAHGWYETTKHGMKKYYYPRLGFNRLTIRDNQEVFDSLFQLYQKGSLPIDIIYELLNLNTEEIHEKIFNDVFTVKDATFNRILDEAQTEVGRQLPDKTDLVERIAAYLKLKVKPPEGQEGGDAGQMGDMSEMQQPEQMQEQPQNEEEQAVTEQKQKEQEQDKQLDQTADAIVQELGPQATPEHAEKAVDAVVEKEKDKQLDNVANEIAKNIQSEADVEPAVDAVLEKAKSRRKEVEDVAEVFAEGLKGVPEQEIGGVVTKVLHKVKKVKS